MRARALALAAVLVTGAAATQALGVPLDGDYPQAHGEMVVGIPDTPACHVEQVRDYRFHNTAYASDPAYSGTYTPACAGPWSKVVMTMSAYVEPGTQFDRIGEVMLGGAELLHFTTPEGTEGRTSWSIQRDVTDYASLFAAPQDVYFQIGNQTDGTYTGDFYGTLAFDFYAADATHPAAAVPDRVLTLGGGSAHQGVRYLGFQDRLSRDLVFPANLTSLRAELFTSGHGPYEEDWWYEPFTGYGQPYREVSISIDGRLAGSAPVFPALFTGGWGPDWWRPIPSPRSLDLRPYTVDLTPFVGELTDGAAHRVSVGIENWTIQNDGGDYWPTAANLLLGVNHDSEERTTGGVTSYSVPGLTTSDTGSQDAGASVFSAGRDLSITGTRVLPSGETSTVTVRSTVDESAQLLAAAFKNDWHWVTSTTTTTGARSAVDTADSTYQLIRDGGRWAFVDDSVTTSSVNGAQTSRVAVQDRMQTSGPALVTGALGASQESWAYQDSTGRCVDHELVGAVNDVIRDEVTSSCTPLLLPVLPPA